MDQVTTNEQVGTQAEVIASFDAYETATEFSPSAEFVNTLESTERVSADTESEPGASQEAPTANEMVTTGSIDKTTGQIFINDPYYGKVEFGHGATDEKISTFYEGLKEKILNGATGTIESGTYTDINSGKQFETLWIVSENGENITASSREVVQVVAEDEKEEQAGVTVVQALTDAALNNELIEVTGDVLPQEMEQESMESFAAYGIGITKPVTLRPGLETIMYLASKTIESQKEEEEVEQHFSEAVAEPNGNIIEPKTLKTVSSKLESVVEKPVLISTERPDTKTVSQMELVKNEAAKTVQNEPSAASSIKIEPAKQVHEAQTSFEQILEHTPSEKEPEALRVEPTDTPQLEFISQVAETTEIQNETVEKDPQTPDPMITTKYTESAIDPLPVRNEAQSTYESPPEEVSIEAPDLIVTNETPEPMLDAAPVVYDELTIVVKPEAIAAQESSAEPAFEAQEVQHHVEEMVVESVANSENKIITEEQISTPAIGESAIPVSANEAYPALKETGQEAKIYEQIKVTAVATPEVNFETAQPTTSDLAEIKRIEEPKSKSTLQAESFSAASVEFAKQPAEKLTLKVEDSPTAKTPRVSEKANQISIKAPISKPTIERLSALTRAFVEAAKESQNSRPDSIQVKKVFSGVLKNPTIQVEEIKAQSIQPTSTIAKKTMKPVNIFEFSATMRRASPPPQAPIDLQQELTMNEASVGASTNA